VAQDCCSQFVCGHGCEFPNGASCVVVVTLLLRHLVDLFVVEVAFMIGVRCQRMQHSTQLGEEEGASGEFTP